MSRLSRIHATTRRTLLRRRRPLAALCAGAAVLAGLHATAGPAVRTVPVTVAAHDLGAGAVVRPQDLRTAGFAPGTAPSGLLRAGAALGRTTTAPIRAGEPITDVRLLGEPLMTGYPGRVAIPVRIPDPGTVSLLGVGDRVDLWVTDPQGSGDATAVALAAPVVAIPATRRAGFGLGLSGRLVVLATTTTEAARLSAASVRGYLSLTLAD